MAETAIQVEHLSKAYGTTRAVDDVSFDAERGTVLGLLGPNAAGKTTLINCLTTLQRPDSGRLTIMGLDVAAAGDKVRAQMAVAGQFAAVDDLLTGRENLVLFGRLLRLGAGRAKARAADLVERLALGEDADRAVKSWSGGMRRRLDLAVSLVVPRPVLILDEPTTGLDPRSRLALWDVVRDLRVAGTTILLTTQYLEEADHLADRILMLDRGRVVAEGTPTELKSRTGGAVCQVRVTDAGQRERVRETLAAQFEGVTVEGELIELPADGISTLTTVIEVIGRCGVETDQVGLRSPTLDEVFLTLTRPLARRVEQLDGRVS